MQQVLELKGVEKKFKGCDALCGVDMTIGQGKIVGLLGPNASGKTTLLKTIAGLLWPCAGEINYFRGAKPGVEARSTISFCPDAMEFPRYMRVRDTFTFYKDMYPDYRAERAERLMEKKFNFMEDD